MQFIDLKTQYCQIETEIKNSIQAVLEHGQFILGPEVMELESQLSAFTGAKHAIGVSSGTDALLLALMALDIGPGDEVITTSFSFFATVEVICLLGATPIFVDIDSRTYNLDSKQLEASITKKTKAIMPISLYGQCADMDSINDIAKKHNIPVIEDAAQSFGATYKGRQSCNLTTIACTSFFPSKPLGCYGDGGACFTNDDDMATRLNELKNHGQSARYHHTRFGINGRLDTIQAAVLIEKLKIFDKELKARHAVAAQYDECLKDKVIVPYIEPYNTSVYAQYTIQVDDRQAVQVRLKEAGIPTAVHYPKPLHAQPALAEYANNVSLPVTEALSEKVMSLPMHPYLTPEQIQHISEVF